MKNSAVKDDFILEISDGECNEEENDNDASAKAYHQRRTGKASKFMRSPYEQHVEQSNLYDSQKNLVSFAWDENLN